MFAANVNGIVVLIWNTFGLLLVRMNVIDLYIKLISCNLPYCLLVLNIVGALLSLSPLGVLNFKASLHWAHSNSSVIVQICLPWLWFRWYFLLLRLCSINPTLTPCIHLSVSLLFGVMVCFVPSTLRDLRIFMDFLLLLLV